MLSQATMIDDFCTFFGMEGVAPDDRRDMWRQIAYALFCDASRSAISSLTFECESITLEDIAAMEEVFDGRWQPDDGAVTPTDIDTATAESAQHVCVTNDAMVRVDGALVSLAILGLSSRDELVVVDDDTGTEWMEVKASSIGRLYIQYEDIVDAGVISDRVLIQQSSRLRSLMLICDRFEPGAAASFIKLVGRGLTTLRIPCKTRRWITASDTKQILQSCPNLQFLGVEHADLKSINVFIEAYEHGWCTLRALSLWDVRVANESLVTFAEKLKDPHHPMTRCLTEFRFIFDEVANSNSVRRPDERGVQAFLSMLHVNWRLNFFELGLDELIYLEYAPMFEPLDRQELQHKTEVCLLDARSHFSVLSKCTRMYPEPTSGGDSSLVDTSERWMKPVSDGSSHSVSGV